MGRREKIIALNDNLRKASKGGPVQMTPAVYNLDPQLRGRALWTTARHSKGTRPTGQPNGSGKCATRCKGRTEISRAGRREMGRAGRDSTLVGSLAEGGTFNRGVFDRRGS